MLRSKGKVSVGEDLSAATGVREPQKSLFIAGEGFDLATKATGSLSGLKDMKLRAAFKLLRAKLNILAV